MALRFPISRRRGGRCSSSPASSFATRRENFWNGEDWKVEVPDDANLVLFTMLLAAFDAPAIAPSSPTA